MSNTDKSSTVLVVTEDIELLSSLLESNTTDFQFISRETMQDALDDSELLTHNNIVIMDIDSINGGTQDAIEQALNLKKVDPTQVLMMVGNQEPLAEILKSNIQPIIYRAFNKPIHPNQIFLSFGSAQKLHLSLVEKQAAGEDILTVGPSENRTNVDSLADQQKKKSVIYAAVGALALAVIGWLIFGNSSDTSDLPKQTIATPTEVNDNLLSSNDDVSRVNQLNQEAAKALLEGRQISPEGDNALYYYDQVLEIDPYDLTAYEGKKTLAAELKVGYQDLVNNAQFDRALETIDVLQTIEPLDTSNYELREKLEVAISAYVKNLKDTGTAEEIDETSAVLARIGSASKSSQTAAAALKKEKTLLANIDNALDKNNLIPPETGNAYAIVSEALQKNTISKVNFAPRISALSEKLVVSANQALVADNLDEAEKLTALIKRLDVDPDNFALLTTEIEDRKTAMAAEAEVSEPETETEAETDTELAVEEAEPAKIIPAKLISRSPPRYPSRALDREVEGWVSIGFKIDTKGLPQDIKVLESVPENVFDTAAISAVEKWRFSPAMNDETKLPVESFVDSTKLQFKISD